MALLNFHKLTSQPATWQASSFYYISNGNYSESYVTDNSAVPKMIGNSTMINELIDAKISASNAGALKIYADIAARDADKVNLTYNQLVLVKNATGDATVLSGAALYTFEKTSNTYSKIAEYESLDVVLSWANISGKPSSTPAQIDDAVTKAHTHINKSTLDALGNDGAGNLTYNGNYVNQWNVTNW